jgi:glycosyltransferase involved in cell wall biosynthesis
LNLGGAESWQLSLVKSVDPELVEWVGLAVTQELCINPKMVRAFEDHMPVTYGLDAAHEVATKADIIIEWAIGDANSLLHGIAPRPVVVAVSHSSIESDWARSTYAGSTGIDRWVAVSELAPAAIPADRRDEATVISNAVTESRLIAKRSRATMRARWGVPEGATVVGYLGRLSEEKNSACMASILPHLPAEYHVVVVGFGWDNKALDAAAACEPRLHLVGPDPDAGSVLAAFDILIVPSDYESFGLTIAEGLHSGVPTISTPVGIAKLTPGLTRPIPIRPTGEQLAAAILDDQVYAGETASRVESAKVWAREHVSSARFGREWTDLITSLAITRQA